MLVDISSCLSVNEHFLDQLRADKIPEQAWRVQSLSLSHVTHFTSRGCTHKRQVSAEPWQGVLEAVPDISEAVRANVTSRMRSALVLSLVISDKDSGSKEEALPIPKIKGLKSSKL